MNHGGSTTSEHNNRAEAIAALNDENNSINTDTEMTSKQRREANLGIVLVSISVMFILCQSVKVIPDCYEVLFCRIGSSGLNSEGQCINHAVIDYIIDISHLMLAINSSANVIIYTIRGELSKVPKMLLCCVTNSQRL